MPGPLLPRQISVPHMLMSSPSRCGGLTTSRRRGSERPAWATAATATPEALLLRRAPRAWEGRMGRRPRHRTLRSLACCGRPPHTLPMQCGVRLVLCLRPAPWGGSTPRSAVPRHASVPNTTFGRTPHESAVLLRFCHIRGVWEILETYMTPVCT